MKKIDLKRRGMLFGALAGFASKNVLSFNPKGFFDRFLETFEQSQDDQDLLSRYADELKDSYDVIVVGSGYGASISAARISSEFKESVSLCVLERGKEFRPEDLPSKLSDLTIRSEVKPDGLIDQSLATTSDLDILQSNGLGGTSLINAAITVRPEKLVFEQREWPKEIQKECNEGEGLGRLERYYKRVENTLSSSTYKDVKSLKKSQVLSEALESRDIPVDYLKLAINYKDQSKTDLARSECTMCGDCCSGCRVGAKNTLQTNYLKIAKDNGASIFTKIEVQRIEKKDDFYILNCRTYHNGVFQTRYVRAKKIILGAGSMGSTGILLKSQANNFKFSKTLGKRLSLNGDVLGLCYNGKSKTEVIGYGKSSRKKAFRSSVGPLITTFGNYRNISKGEDLSERFLLLDGAIPSPLANVTAAGISSYAMLNKNDFNFTREQWDRVKKDLPINLIGSNPSAEGALNHSTLFLSCGHDRSKGEYFLDSNAQLRVKWDNITDESFYKIVTKEMKAISKEMGGVYIANPRTTVFGGKMVATHPLGGCCMGDNVNTSVVNHVGEVFDRDGELHVGLYVLDGSIIPRSLGATPLLTISMLAERAVEYIIDDLKS